MNRLLELDAAIKAKNDLIVTATHDMLKLLDEIAPLAASAQVGDKFTFNGYPFHGKKGQVMSLKARFNYGHVHVIYTVAVLKKDGTPSAQQTDVRTSSIAGVVKS